MGIKSEVVGDVKVITVLRDTIESGNAPDFKKELLPEVAGCTKLLLDLGRVQFIDSMGCGVLLSCLRELSANHGELKLCSVTKKVRVVFELIRMHRLVDIFNDREEALKSFGG